MHTHEIYYDSLVINVINLKYFNKQIQQFYKKNNLVIFNRKDKNNNPYRTIKAKPTKAEKQQAIKTAELIRTYQTGQNQYLSAQNSHIQSITIFSFAGIKSYNHKMDTIKYNLITKFINFLREYNIPYILTRLDVAYDISNLHSIENILAMRVNKVGLSKPLNNPFNYFESTSFYLEEYVKTQSLKTIVYDKTIKEHSRNNPIVDNITRAETSIRNLKRKSFQTKQELIDFIQNQLNKYLIVRFDSIDNCNELKNDYEYMIKKRITKPSKEFKQKILNFSGVEVERQLSDEIIAFISKLYCENLEHKIFNSRISTNNRIKNIIQNIGGKKEKRKDSIKPINANAENENIDNGNNHLLVDIKILIDKQRDNLVKKISIPNISKVKMFHKKQTLKNSVLQLNKDINIILINPLILKVFQPHNKAPPIINPYLHP